MITNVTTTSVTRSNVQSPTIRRNVISIRPGIQPPVRMMQDLFRFTEVTQSVRRHRKIDTLWDLHKAVSTVVYETSETLGNIIWKTKSVPSFLWPHFLFYHCKSTAHQICLANLAIWIVHRTVVIPMNEAVAHLGVPALHHRQLSHSITYHRLLAMIHGVKIKPIRVGVHSTRMRIVTIGHTTSVSHRWHRHNTSIRRDRIRSLDVLKIVTTVKYRHDSKMVDFKRRTGEDHAWSMVERRNKCIDDHKVERSLCISFYWH